MDNISEKWPDIMHFLTPRAKRNAIWRVIGRLILGSALYHIWQERYMRLFQKGSRSVDTLVSCIFKEVRLKMLSLSFKESANVVKAFKVWKIDFPRKSEHG